MSYQGVDRRRYRVFVTDNCEYHLRDEVCIAVRGREDAEWLLEHPAIGGRLLGDAAPRELGPGDVLRFDNEHVSSEVRAVERPSHFVPAPSTKPE